MTDLQLRSLLKLAVVGAAMLRALPDGRLRRRQARDRYAERRARHVVQAQRRHKGDAGGVAAVLACSCRDGLLRSEKYPSTSTSSVH